MTGAFGSPDGVAMLENWFFSDGVWPGRLDGAAPTYYILGTTTGAGTIAQAVALATFGDIIVLPEGTYTESFILPAGVTLRAEPCSNVVVKGAVSVSGYNTFREIEFIVVDGSQTVIFDNVNGLPLGPIWFEACTFHPEGELGTFHEDFFTSIYVTSVTFNRCLFTEQGSLVSPTWYYAGIAGAGADVKFYSCVFVVSGGSDVFTFWAPRSLVIDNCTFILKNGSGFFLITASPGPSGVGSRITRNIIVSKLQDSGTIYIADSSTSEMLVKYNYSFGFTALANAIDFDVTVPDSSNVNYTTTNQAHLADLTNNNPSPRTGTPGLTTEAN